MMQKPTTDETVLPWQQTDAWFVVGVARLILHGRQVKIHLARELQLESLHFQINHDV